jgi:hypothetical protein
VKLIDAFTRKEYNVALHETFTVGDDRTGEEKYTVKSVDGTKKTIVIKKIDNGVEYELNQKVLEYKKDIPAVDNPALKSLGMPPAAP